MKKGRKNKGKPKNYVVQIYLSIWKIIKSKMLLRYVTLKNKLTLDNLHQILS